MHIVNENSQSEKATYYMIPATGKAKLQRQ